MRLATLVACILLIPSCRLGPGKFPNPQWEPSVDTTELLSSPVTFTALELDFTLTRAAWECTTEYVLTRIPHGETYDLHLEGFVTDPGGGVLRQHFEYLELQLLDAQDRVITTYRDPQLRTDGPGAEDGTRNFVARIRIGPATRPVTLVVGETAVRLGEDSSQ